MDVLEQEQGGADGAKIAEGNFSDEAVPGGAASSPAISLS
jgi:hypothetical protein